MTHLGASGIASFVNLSSLQSEVENIPRVFQAGFTSVLHEHFVLEPQWDFCSVIRAWSDHFTFV